MMYLWSCNRRDFFDYMISHKPLLENEIIKAEILGDLSVYNENLTLVWNKSPTKKFLLPFLIIVADDRIDDFLAWVSTYFRDIRPFTAFCRVITPSLIHIYRKNINDFSVAKINIGSADIGLIIAEVMSYSKERFDLNRFPFYAHARTLSYLFSESINVYGDSLIENDVIFEQTINGWILARKFANQTALGLTPQDISDVWSIILNASSNTACNYKTNLHHLLVQAIKSIQLTGRIPNDLWMYFSIGLIKDNFVIEAMDGPREGRIKYVREAIMHLSDGTDETRKLRSFLAGYLVSLIQPGSLDHYSILLPSLDKLSDSILWYGACSGLNPKTSVETYGNGLGFLIKRELERPSNILDRPNADIALSELSILLNNREANKPIIRTIVSGLLKVEILPMVSTIIKWMEYPNEITENQDKVFDRKNKNDEMLIQAVLELGKKIEENQSSFTSIYKQIVAKFGEAPPKKRGSKKMV